MTALALDDGARRAYDVFAAFYDEFTADHRVDEWTTLLERLAAAAGLRGRRLLDVACGTGRCLAAMRERGYEVSGCDISPRMLAVARRRLPAGARLAACDMRALPALGSFDLVWILGDAVNYLDGPDELADTFAGVRRNLAGGGILIFDAATLLSFRTSYAGLLVRPGSERVLVLDGHGDPALPAGGAAEVWIDRLRPEGNGGWWRRERTVHHLRHHPEPVIRGALAAAGLACVDVRGNRAGGEAEPWLDELSHTKALYIARQEAPDRDEGR